MSYLGVDVGTHSVKVCVIDDQRELLALEERQHSVRDFTIDPREVTQNVEALISAINRAASIRRDPATHVSICALGEAIVLFDANGESELSILGPNQLGRRTSQRLSWDSLDADPRNHYYSSFKLKALVERREFDPAVRVSCWEDFLLWLWTGSRTMSDTMALRTGAYDVARQQWNRSFLDQLGLAGSFPLSCAVNPAGTLLRPMKRAVAHRMSFQQRPILVQGAWDIYGAVIGAELQSEQLLVNFGSVLLFARLLASAEALSEGFHTISRETFASSVGALDVQTVYSPGILFSKIERRLRMIGPQDPSDLVLPASRTKVRSLNIEAEKLLDSKGQLHSIGGLRDSDFPAMEVLSCVFEAAAFEVRRRLEGVGAGADLLPAIAVGGGASNAAWISTLANVLGVPVVVPRCVQATAIGAATIAMSAPLGVSLATRATLSPAIQPRHPEGDRLRLYDREYEKWRVINWHGGFCER